MNTKSEKGELEELSIRFRTLSADFTYKQQNLQNIVHSNEQVITQQSKLISRLTEQQSELSSQNSVLSKEVLRLRSGGFEETYDKIKSQNIELQNKIEELELLLAKSKIESASKEQEILLAQLELNRLGSNSSKLLEKQRNLKGPDALSKSKIVRIIENGISSRISQIQDKQNFSDGEVKQWIKYIQLKESSQEATVNKVKQKCKSIIKSFIPRQLRRIAWPLFIQNKLALTPSLFSIFQKMPSDEKVKTQIQKDIDRWFTIKGQKNQAFKADLLQILQVFNCYRPDISYVQGMTYPAGILLMVLDKYKAWECCCNIMLTNQVVYNLYSFNLEKIALYCRTFDYLLSQNCESITNRLDILTLHSEIYLIQWFYTLFSRSFSLPIVFKIWDLIVYYGQAILFRVSLGIFDQLKTDIESMDYDQCIETIKNFNNKIDEEKLMEYVVDHKLTTQKLRSTFSKVEQLTESRSDLS